MQELLTLLIVAVAVAYGCRKTYRAIVQRDGHCCHCQCHDPQTGCKEKPEHEVKES